MSKLSVIIMWMSVVAISILSCVLFIILNGWMNEHENDVASGMCVPDQIRSIQNI